MEDLDERVALLEGRIGEQSMRIDDVREAMASLEARFDRRFEHLEQRLDQRFASLDQRLGALDAKVGRQFVTLVGLMVTALIAIIGGMGGIISAVLSQ